MITAEIIPADRGPDRATLIGRQSHAVLSGEAAVLSAEGGAL